MRAHPRRFTEWQEFSAGDPEAATKEIVARIANLPQATRRAMFAWQPGAESLAEELARRTGPLHGVPYVIKDLYDLPGAPTYGGSTFLPEVRPVPTEPSAIVAALRKAGAACAGKTHLHEFAFGNTGENPHYGDCPHPRFPDRLAGGSSSGSAAAVGAGIVPFAVGTDTAGSIRGPAAFCGIFGFRLVPGHEWIRDAFPLAPSFDTAGWFTGNARDMEIANAALIGGSEPARTLNGCYLAYGDLDPEVAEACRAAAARFCAAADSQTEAQLRGAFTGGAEAYSVLSSVEAAAAHAGWLDSHKARFSAPVWERIDKGRKRTEDEKMKGAVRRQVVRSVLSSYFLTYDYLVMPAVPLPALTKAQCTLENRTRMLELCAPASLAGLPALTIPVPLPSGLTAGLQIVAPEVTNPVYGWILRQSGSMN